MSGVAREGKAWQGKAWQGKAWQGREKQGKATLHTYRSPLTSDQVTTDHRPVTGDPSNDPNDGQ